MHTSPGCLTFSDLHIPQAWGSRLGISGSLSFFMSYMGSARLGPDHLQAFRCSKEAEPLQGHPAHQSLWTCSGVKLGWEQGQLFCLQGPQPFPPRAWTEGQMSWAPCSVGLAGAEGTLGQNWPDQTSCLPRPAERCSCPQPCDGEHSSQRRNGSRPHGTWLLPGTARAGALVPLTPGARVSENDGHRC